MRYHITFLGRVQGVGFRATARAVAGRHPRVTGWVRNQPDGTVAMAIEGPPTDLDRYLADLRGVMGDHIHDTHLTADDPGPSATPLVGFEIRR